MYLIAYFSRIGLLLSILIILNFTAISTPLAEYAKKNQTIGKIQLIRKGELGGVKQFVRLDLAKTVIRKKVLNATTPEELNKIFDIDGEYE